MGTNIPMYVIDDEIDYENTDSTLYNWVWMIKCRYNLENTSRFYELFPSHFLIRCLISLTFLLINWEKIFQEITFDIVNHKKENSE